MTAALTLRVGAPLVLSPRTDPGDPAPGALYADTGSFSAPVHDRTQTRYGPGCARLVVAWQWSIDLGTGAPVLVRNADPDEHDHVAGLISCHGALTYTGGKGIALVSTTVDLGRRR